MALRDYPDKVLCGGATLIGIGAASLLLLAVLPHSQIGCSVYDIFFSNHACHQNWWILLLAFLFPLIGILCFLAIIFSKEKRSVLIADVAGVLYALAMLYFLSSASGSLAGMH